MPFSQPAVTWIQATRLLFKLNAKGCASGRLPFGKAELLLAQHLRGCNSAAVSADSRGKREVGGPARESSCTGSLSRAFLRLPARRESGWKQQAAAGSRCPGSRPGWPERTVTVLSGGSWIAHPPCQPAKKRGTCWISSLSSPCEDEVMKSRSLSKYTNKHRHAF